MLAAIYVILGKPMLTSNRGLSMFFLLRIDEDDVEYIVTRQWYVSVMESIDAEVERKSVSRAEYDTPKTDTSRYIPSLPGR